MSRALVVRLSRLRDIGRPHVWSTGRISLPFPPAPCHFAGFGGERKGRAEPDEYCKTQTNGRDSLSTLPANADVLGASAWVDHWQAMPPVPKYLQIPTPPFATLGCPCPPVLPAPVGGVQAKNVRSGDCELRRSLVVGDLSQPLVSSLYALAQVAPTVDHSTVAVCVVLGPLGDQGGFVLEPTHGPTVSAPLRVEPSNLQPNLSRLPGRAFLSACRMYPVSLPVPAVSCSVVCRVLCACVCVACLFSRPVRSFVRFLALQPTKLPRSPSLPSPSPSDSLPLSPQVTPD